MTYKEKAIKLIQEKLKTSQVAAIDIINLLDEYGEYKPCVLGVLDAPEDVEDWNVEIIED